MSSPDYTATAILTEHLGFPPISVIDDVINAVNDIMYKCTQAMETYLVDRQQKRQEELRSTSKAYEDVDMDQDMIAQEIQVGTAKLETLLENEVSKNFDKFELYSLRNLFTIPHDLIENGWFKLKHHEGIQFNDPKWSINENIKLDTQIETLLKDIEIELQLRKILKLQIVRATKLIKTLGKYREMFKFLKSPNSLNASNALKSVSPIYENLYYLLSQTDELIQLVQKIQIKLAQSSDIKFIPTSRERYINNKTLKLLDSIGVLEDDQQQQQQEEVKLSGVTITEGDLENVKLITNVLQKMSTPLESDEMTQT